MKKKATIAIFCTTGVLLAAYVWRGHRGWSAPLAKAPMHSNPAFLSTQEKTSLPPSGGEAAKRSKQSKTDHHSPPFKFLIDSLDEWKKASDSIWFSPNDFIAKLSEKNPRLVDDLQEFMTSTKEWSTLGKDEALSGSRPDWVLRRMAALDLLASYIQMENDPTKANAGKHAMEEIARLGLGIREMEFHKGGLVAESCEAIQMLAVLDPDRALAFHQRHSHLFVHKNILNCLANGLHDVGRQLLSAGPSRTEGTP